MDRVKLEFKSPSIKRVEYNGVIIEIDPFLSLASQVFLINNYLTEYFEKSDENVIRGSKYAYISAESSLMNYLYQVNTNIDTDMLSNDFYVNKELWDIITSQISNYSDFRNRLDYLVQERKEQIAFEYSVEKLLFNFLEKAKEFLDKLNNITPEEIQKIQDSSQELIKKLEASSVLTATPKASRKKKAQ